MAKRATKKKAKKKATKKKAKKGKKGEGPLTLAERREKIRERYAKPVVIYEDDVEPPRVPTRFVRFNGLVGGGLKRGAIIEVYGPEDSGKTSTAIALAADIQARSPKGKDHVVMTNYELPQDYPWWRKLGLKTDKDHFTQLRPKTLEEGMGDSSDLIESNEVCAVIYDSVYAASAKDSAGMLKSWSNPSSGGQAGAGGISVEARQWGKAWTAVKGLFVEHDVVAIAVNQLREKPEVGKGRRKSYGPPPTTTPRGHALKFYAWLRLELKGSSLVDEENNLRKDVDGRRVRIRVVKNKTSADDRGLVYYDLIRGFGFDLVGDLIDLALEAGVIKGGGGGHYQIGKTKIRGRARVRSLIEGSERLQAVLRTHVDRHLDDTLGEVSDADIEPED